MKNRLNVRKFMHLVRKSGIFPKRLRKIDKWSSKPYVAGYSDIPAWTGKSLGGEDIYITVSIAPVGCGLKDTWFCQCGETVVRAPVEE